MIKINGTTISLTRGDSLYAEITLTRSGETYTPVEGDVIRFTVKESYKSATPLISKTIPTDTLILHLLPEDTKSLRFKDYVYDIEMDYANGDVDTFIAEAKLIILPEVT